MMDSSTEEVGLMSDLLIFWGGLNTLCVWFEVKKKTGISIVAVVLSYALPLELAWQPDWWQISVVMFRTKDSFPSNSFQFSMSALILSMCYDFRFKWDWDSLFQSSTNPLVSNSPPLPASNPWPLLTPATQVRQIFTFRAHQQVNSSGFFSPQAENSLMVLFDQNRWRRCVTRTGRVLALCCFEVLFGSQ